MTSALPGPDQARPELMADADPSSSTRGKFTGMPIDLLGLGKAQLTDLINENGETSVYHVDRPGVVVKLFNLECGKPDELSYGPYVAFNLERENFQDIDTIPELKRCVPAFYGAAINYERKYASITMEFLPGQNLREWYRTELGQELDRPDLLRAAIYQTLTILTRFHRHGIFLIDFKPDNVIRLRDGGIKFVDLGAFFTPRHSQNTENYVYSTTPDYAELVIDTSNVQTGLPLNQSSDIFAAGVALFEMTTGNSRVAIANSTADQILALPEIYRFRDTQIRDVWHAYPHLRDALPLVESQLQDRHILFAEIWYLIKGLLAEQVPAWESIEDAQQRELLLQVGTDLIREQLPAPLDWLASAIAAATTLRSYRVKTIAELMQLVADPVSADIRASLMAQSGLVRHLQDNGLSASFVDALNVWEVRCNEETGAWAILIPVASQQLGELAPFTFLKCTVRDRLGNAFYQIVSDSEAEVHESSPLAMAHLEHDYLAWVS